MHPLRNSDIRMRTHNYPFQACSMLLLICLPACVLGTAAPQASAMPGSAISPASPAGLSRLAEGVFACIVSPASDLEANAGVIQLESGVLLFDSRYTPEAGRALEEQIRQATSLPVRYLVNSHFHPDHTHGNQAFTTVRQGIVSTQTRRDMLQKDLPELNRARATAEAMVERLNKEISRELDSGRRESLRTQLQIRQTFLRRVSALQIIAPSMTLDDTLRIVDGEREVKLLRPGAAHTDGDVILYLAKEKIAFTGDIFFNNAFPSVVDASLVEWMKTLRQVLQLDAETFVPGHGPVGTKRDVEDFLAYLEDLRALVAPAVERGDTLEQTVQDLRLPAKYAAWALRKYFPLNVQKMYVELKAEKSKIPSKAGAGQQEPGHEYE